MQKGPCMQHGAFRACAGISCLHAFKTFVALLLFCLAGKRQSPKLDKATAGDTHLGGEDFDNRVVDFCIQDFKQPAH